MAKQYKVLVNTAKAEDNTVLVVPQAKGGKVEPLRIPAKVGQKYQLQELSNASDKPRAPDYVKSRRVGKDLHIVFEGDKEASVIIEDYYDVVAEGSNSLIGQAENGSFYDYIPEDPQTDGLVANLRDGGEAINVALGGTEVQGAGAAVGLLAGTPLLGLLGLAGAGAVAAAAAANAGTTTTTTPTGRLAPVAPNDSSTLGDNLTNDNTPTITGTVPAGSTATMTLNGKTYPVTVNTDGTYSFTIPDADKLPDGTYTPRLNVTSGGTTTSTDVTPFTIDTVTNVAISNPGTAGTTNPISGTAEAGDVVLLKDPSGNTLGSTTANSAGQWTFTPTANVPSGSVSATATDPAGNTATANGNNNSTDSTAPTVVVTSDKTSLSSTQTAAITFTLSESSTDFTAADVTVTGGALSNFTGSGTSYSATFTPTAGATSAALLVDSNKFSDAAGNFNKDGAEANNAVSMSISSTPADTTPPTIAVSTDKTSLATNQTATITFTLSEASTDFTSSDVTVIGGTLSNFTGSGTSYTATFTPNANATSAVLVVDSSKFSDAAGNFNKDGADTNNSLSMSISSTPVDTTPPTIALSSDKANLTSGQTATITFTLSEASTDFTAADVTVVGGALSNFTGSGTSYTATFTPNAGATSAALVVDSAKFSDAAGNFNKDGADANNTVSMSISSTPADTTAPTISVSTDKSSLTSGQTATITFTLSEASTDFTASDVTVTGGTLSNFQGSGTSYTATFTPNAGATSAALTVASDKFSDAAGNLNKDGADTNNSVSMSISNTPTDTTAPTIAVSSDKTSLSSGQTATITFTLSESSTDFTANDVTVIGGTLSNFTGSGTSYTATFTPNANATSAALTVASDKFSDAAGNFNKDGADTNNTVSMSVSNTPADTTAPTISVSSDKTSLSSGQTATITFTLSETSTDFTASDVTVTGGTLSNFQGSGTSYTATFTPNANATSAALTVASDKFSDAAGNFNKDGADTNNSVSMSISNTPADTTAPTISVSSDKTSLASGQTATITFTLSESSTDFTASDVTVTGGTLSNFTGSGTSYTATFTPNAGATSAALTVASDKFSDAAGNLNKDGADTNNSVSMSISNTPADTIAPTISVSSDKTSLASGQTATITFTLSESSTDFTASDVTVTGGTLSNFTGSGTSYTATFTPNAGATSAALTVASDKFSDAAGNLNKDGADTNNSVSMSVSNTPADTIAPTISVSSDKTSLASGQTATITFTLSESSTDFTANDVTVIGGTLSNFTGSGTSYTATFTPNANATSAALTVASDKFSDAAGNLNKDGADTNNTVSMSVSNTPADTTAPTISVSSDKTSLSSGQTATITFTLSESSTDFTANDVTVIGGTLSNFTGSGTSYTATFTPNANATSAALTVASDKFSDAAGNFNKDGADTNNSVSMSISNTPADTTAPTISVSSDKTSLSSGQTATITFTLSESSTDFTASDVTVTGGTLSNFQGSGTSYTATFTPNAGATSAALTVASDKFSDAAGNLNKDGADTNNSVSMSVSNTPADTTAPTISVSSDKASLSSGQTASITFNLSESSTDFTANDVTLIGGTLTNFTGSGTSYTATFTPNANATSAALTVASDKFSDAAGNFNKDGADTNNTVSMSVSNTPADTTAPTISVSSDKTSLSSGQTATITFTLSETSTDFTASDVTVTGGTLSNFQGSGTSYTATFTPNANATSAALTVASDKFSDAAGNLNKDGADTNNSVSMSISNTPADTTPPTIAVSSDKTTLTGSQTATITFTLSESSVNFTASDVTVIGGALSNFQGSGTAYTATFTPFANSTSAAIIVASDRFTDATGNLNKDGADTNNTVSLSIDKGTPAAATGKLSAVAPNDSGTLGDNTTNDTTPTIIGTVPVGSTATITLNGKNYPVTVNADGTYSFTIPDADKLPDGTYTPKLNVTTNGTTTTTDATPFTIDTVTNVAISNPGAGGTTNPISGTAEAGDIVVIKDASGNVLGSTTANSNGQWTFTPTSAVPTGDVQAVATDAAGNTANATGKNAASVKTALTIDPITGDNIVNTTEGAATSLTVTGKVTGTFAAGDIVTLVLNGKNYTAVVGTNGSYSTAVSMADIKADSDTKIEGTVTGTGGQLATAAQDYVVETNANAGTQTALSIDPVTADNILGSTESTGNIPVTGKVTGKFSAGDTVTLTVNGKTFTGTVAANGTYSISVPATDLLADTDTKIEATITGNGGTAATAVQDYGVDANINPTPTPTPSVKTALTIDPITGDNIVNTTEGAATSLTVTGKVTGTFAAGDTVTLVLNGKNYSALVGTDGSYSTAVSMADIKADSDTKIEGTVTGTGGQLATAAQDYVVETNANAGTQTALSIDPVTADNILGSTESTGNIPVTGKVTGKFSAGDTVTLTVNGKTFTGTVAANGTYSISVPATDLLADTDTKIEATITGNGGTAATAVQDYGVDANINPTPTPTPSVKTALTIDPITGDNIVNTTEGAATSLTVTGKVTGTFAAGDTVTLVLNGKNYTAVVGTDGSYSTAVSMADIKADSDTKIEGTVTGTGGQLATAAQDYVVETTANAGTQTALSIDPVTADNILGSTESTGNIPVTGKVTGKFSAGDTVTLTVNGKTFTGTVAANGTYSINVPATDLLADTDTKIEATITGNGGTAATAVQDYGVDANINPTPTPTPSVKTALTIDPITGDNIVNTTEGAATSLTVTGKVTGTFAAGDTVTLVLNGKNYTAVVGTDGSYSTAVSMADIKADSDTKIEGTVTGTGGQLATAAQDYVVETTANAGTQTALTIDPVTADNILGSTESTGNIPVTGKVTGKFSAGDTVTLTVNGKTFTGTVAANGTYSINVPASDLLADTDTQVDGSVTGTGGTKATAVQDYGIDANINPTPAPSPSVKTALTIDPITGDNIVNTTEGAATSLTVTGKVTGTFAAGDTVNLVFNGKNYTAVVGTNGSYSTAVSMADIKADSDTKIEGTVTGTGGQLATAAQDYVVETTANAGTQTALSIDPVTADNILGSTESTGNIPVTGNVTGKFSAGDTVTLTVNGKTFTGTVAANGTYSINVPASDLLADTDTQVDGSVTGTGGTKATAVQDYGIDANINPTPTPNPSVKTALTIDPITGDNIVNTTEGAATSLIVTGKVTGTFAAGDTVTLVLNGKNYTAVVGTDGSYSTAVSMADIKADSDTKIEGTVTGTGGQLATAAQDYVVETTANAGTQTALSIDPVTADNILGSTESTGNIPVTGKVTGKFSAGDTVTLTVNGKTFTGTVAANGTYSINVPATDLLADTDTQVDGSVTGTGGTKATAVQDYGVDANINPTPTPTPSVKTALTIDPITGDNIVTVAEGGTTSLTVTGKVTGTFAAGDTVTLVLNGKNYSAVVGTDGSYSTAVSMADIKADSDTKIEGTVTGTGGQLATAAQDYVVETTANAGTQTALSIDPVTADNILGSTESTGNIPVTGKVTGKFSAGDTVTLTVNGKTFTGTVAANGTYSINVPATDLLADTDTKIEATITGNGGTTGTAVQDYGVDANINPTPTPTPSVKTALTIDPITGDNIVTVAEGGASSYTVTGKVTGTFAAGDTVTLVLNGKNYTAVVGTDGSYSTAVSMADIKADSDTKIEGTVTGTGGQLATAAQDYVVETTANAGTQTALSIDPVTADNILGSTESTGNIPVTGKVTGKFSAGDTVTLTVNGKTFTGTVAANGTYSINVPATDLLADTDTQVDGSVTGTGGTKATAVQDYGVDADINPAPATLKTALTIDPITGDNIVTVAEGGATSYTVTGKVTGTFAAGDIVTLVLNGKNYTAVVGTDGSYNAAVSMADIKADSDTKIDGTVTGTGGSLATAAQDYVVETAANAGTQTALSINPVTADNILGSTESTGNITLTGTVSGKFSVGDIVTLVINGKNFTGPSAANGSYSISVPAADLLADADSKVDASVTGTGGTLAKAAQDYGVDANINPAPVSVKTALTINPIAGDNIVNTTEGAATTYTVTGQVTGTFAAGDTVTLVLNGKNYTAVVGTDGRYSVPVSMADIKADSDTKIEGSVTGTGGQLATAAQDYVVETTANAGTQTALSINPVTADNILGSTESTGNIPVTGKVTGKFSAGDTVTLVVNGKNFTGSAAADGSYSINVPASDLLADTDTQVDGSVTGTGGTKATAVQDYGVDANINPADTTPPTIMVARSGTASPLTGSENITFTLSEASTNFGLNDIDVTGGTMSNFAPVPTSGTAGAGYTQYTATFKPNSGSGTATIGVASGKFADNAGNVNLDTYQSGIAGTVQESNNSTSITFNTSNADTTPPTIIVARAGTGNLSTGGTETITFTVSENTFLDSLAVTVTGGSLSNFAPVSSSGDLNVGFTQYTATFTPTANTQGTATIGVANGKFVDAAGNINVDTFQSGVSGTVQEANNQVSIGFNTTAADTTAPTVAVTRAGTGTVTSAGETVYFTLSEASTNFTASDVDVGNGSISNFAPVPSSGNSTSGFTQYVATFTPATGAGVATVGVKSGQFSDAAGNNNTDTYVKPAPAGTALETNNQVSLDFNTGSADTTAPTVAITRSSNNVLLVNNTETITFVLSEASTDFSSADITVSGGSLSNFQGSGTTYTATFTPSTNASGVAVIGVASSKFSDAAGNQNKDTFLSGVAGTSQEANNSVAITFNTVPASAPTVSADTVSATEAGGTNNGTTFVDPTGNVLSNDTAVTAVLQVQDIKAGTGAGTATAVNANSTSTSSGTTVNGTFGTLVIGADGSYKYTPNNANTNVQALRTSTDTVTDVFTYTVKDGNGKTSSTTLTATISGSNDAPVVSMAQADRSATIGTAFSYTVPTTGTGATFTDVDSGDSLTYTATLEGGGALPSWLSFDASTKTFSGTPPSGTTAGTLNVTVTATDKGSLSASDTFSISVGNNNAPTLSTITAPSAVTEATNATAQKLGSLTGTLSVNDVDNGNTVTASTTAASAVYSGGATLPSGVDVSALIASSALTFGAGVTPNGTASSINWTYNPSAANLDWLPKGQTLTLTYPVTVSDGQGGTAKQNLVITVTGTNDAPTASAISQSFNKGAAQSTINLLNNAADVDQGETATLKVDSSFTPTFVVTTDSSNGTAQASSTTVPAGVIFDAAAGTLKIDPSNSTISTGLASGQKQTIVASYKIIDAQGATVDTTATIVINGSGSNDPVASNDTATATEAGGSANGTAGTNPTGNVLTNDSIVVGTKTLQDVKLSSASTATAVTAGSTSSSNATTITGSFGSLVIGANGSYTYNVDNANTTVQALRTSSNTLTDNFTYTLKDGQGGTSTATLAVTVQGANDAPVAVADTATAKEAGGSANGTAGTDPTGNVLNNDTDVDKDDTKVVQDAKAGTTGSVVTVSSGSTSTNSASTITGTFGALKLGADGSYSYVVDNANTTVQALKSSTDTVTDTFTYTVKDAAGATSSNTITVTVQGANDAPAVSTATTPSSTQTNLQAFNFGTAFSLADIDVGTGTMTLTLSSNVNDGRITVTPGTSGATITSGNGTNSVVISGTLAQLQALTGTASNFSFVDSASQTAKRDVTISALLNDNGNQGGTSANALTGSNSFTVSMAADPNASAKIDITAISTDTGVSTTDYVTSDNTLVYSGTVSSFTNNGDKVKLELLDSKGTVVASTTVTPTLNGSNGTWTWNDPVIAASSTRADGIYTLRATIVDPQGDRVAPATTVGSNTGTQDVQAVEIDTNTPNVDPNKDATIDIVRIDDALSSTTAATGSKDTGASSTDFVTSDGTLKYFGTLTGFDGTKNDLVKLDFKDSTGAVLRSVFVTPTLDTATNSFVWTWDDTANTLASGSYTLVATIIDQAGNVVNTKAPVNGTNGGTDSQLIVIDSAAPTQTVTFSSMTKDTGTNTVTTSNTSANANWTTADASAGRLVSGSISAKLGTNDVVEVFANDGNGAVKIGNAVVNGTHWAITDTLSHVVANANSGAWTYSAKVSNLVGSGTTKTQTVLIDTAEDAPVITAIVDTANTTVASNTSTSGSTTNGLSKVSGTGTVGSTIYLYDNSQTNLVGSTTVDSSGKWTVNLSNLGGGSNTFAAVSLDNVGNPSVFSNLVTATSAAANGLANGDFSSGNTGFTSTLTSLAPNGGQPVDTAEKSVYKVQDISQVNVQNVIGNNSVTTPQSGSGTFTNGTWSTKFRSTTNADVLGGLGGMNPDGSFKGNLLTGQASTTGGEATLWSSTASVVAGKTYTFTMDYFQSTFLFGAIPVANEHDMRLVLDGQNINFTKAGETGEVGHLTVTYTATETKTIALALTANPRNTNGSGGDFMLDNFSFAQNLPSNDNTLVAGKVFGGATVNADGTLAYSDGALTALSGDDVISVTDAQLQAKLKLGGYIDGDAGVDTLKLAASTVLDLGQWVGNQTVKPIQEVEIFQLQGSSTLSISANDVLSLGGSNASTMSGFSFSSTSVGSGASFSSTGKVQFVVKGTSTDKVNLLALQFDGVLDSAGEMGNTGLAGQWSNIGTTTIGGVTYQVFNHSTTQAQVLVSNATVNVPISPLINITAISTDSGVSTSDYITSDNTLVYSGTVSNFSSTGDKVKLELLDSTGTVVANTTVTPTLSGSNGTWTWNDPVIAASSTRADGDYTLRATVVDAQGNRVAPATTVGSNTGTQDVQTITIDTNSPNVDPNKDATIDIVRIDDGLSTTASTGSKDTGASSTDFVTSDGTLKYFGTLTGFDGTKNDLVKLDFKDNTGAVLRSVFVTPTLDTATNRFVWSWDDTANSLANGNYTLVATIIDQAGNVVNTKAPVNGTNGGTDSQLIVIDGVLPTQTVTFSSMTKDSGISTVTSTNSSANANWTTADASAGRLVSGSISAKLGTNEVVEVFANDGNGAVKIGNAVVNGTQWEITDTLNHLEANVASGAWVYSAKVSNSVGSGTTKTQTVVVDYVEDAPVITTVTDGTNTSLASKATTNSQLKTISGTGNPGDILFLVENTSQTVVGSSTVDGTGKWTVNMPGTAPGGTNSYAAYQMDPHGNQSVLSNVWQINQNIPIDDGFNGSFGTTYTNDTVIAGMTKVKGTPDLHTVGGANIPANTIASPDGGAFYSAVGTIFAGDPAAGFINEQSSFKLNNLVVGKTYAMDFFQSVIGWDNGGLLWNGAGNFEFYNGTTLLGSSTEMAAIGVIGSNKWTADTVKFTASAQTMDITIVVKSNNGASGTATRLGLDGFSVTQVADSTSNADSTLKEGNHVGNATANADTLNFVEGGLDGLAGDDVFTATSATLPAKLNAGAYIDGGAGLDTLKLAVGTVLDLDQLTRNQTVKTIKEVEIFQLQGGSTLSLTANDVLSLGGSNVTTMNSFTFSSTTSGSGTGFDSTGKVQFVVKGSSTDTVKLNALQIDGVLNTAGESGNTGLAGSWTDIGLVKIGGVNYQVFNHSTTQAQVLISNATVELPTNAQTVSIAAASVNSTSFTQDFASAQSGFTQKSTTTGDGLWTISATGASGKDLPALDVNNTNVHPFYVSIGDRLTALTGTELKLGEQSTQTTAGGRREYTFKSNTGQFDFVEFRYTDVNFTSDLWISFFDAAGNLIERTSFTASAANNSLFTHNIKNGALASSFMIDMNTDDTWGLDKLRTGVQQGTIEVTSGGSAMDTTPLLKGAYSANLATGEVIAIYDGSTKLGTATIDANTKTWTFQVSSDLSATTHTLTAKVESSTGTATATSSNFTLSVLASPLALDLNGDGVQTIGAEQGVQFDLLNTGAKQSVGWVDKQDGFLVMDLNHDGVVNNGSELLGSSTQLSDGSLAKDGWQALTQYDVNADGFINTKDAAFLELKVWVDANSNGVTDVGELQTLSDVGIQSINLAHNNVQTAQNGNILQGFSSFTTTDGASHEIVDAWLKVDDSVSVTPSLNGPLEFVTPTGVVAATKPFDLTSLMADGSGQVPFLNITGTVQADGSTPAHVFKLDAADLSTAQLSLDGSQQALHISGDANDCVHLTDLLQTGPAQGQWQAAGTVLEQGVAYNSYVHSGHQALTVLIDQHVQQVHLG